MYNFLNSFTLFQIQFAKFVTQPKQGFTSQNLFFSLCNDLIFSFRRRIVSQYSPYVAIVFGRISSIHSTRSVK